METSLIPIGKTTRKWTNLDLIRSRIKRLEGREILAEKGKRKLERLKKKLVKEEERATKLWKRSCQKKRS